MDLSRFNLAESVTIAAPPEAVWATISDITRMGEFSPVNKGGQWDDPATGVAEGVWFTGDNETPERSWSTRCLVESAEPGVRFSFVNHGSTGDIPIVRWTYAMSPTAGGTEVTETWQVLDGYSDFLAARAPNVDVEEMLEGSMANTGPGMAATLAALKRACES